MRTIIFLVLVPFCSGVAVETGDIRFLSIKSVPVTFRWSERQRGDSVGGWEVLSITNGKVKLKKDEKTIQFPTPADPPDPKLVAVLAGGRDGRTFPVCLDQPFDLDDTRYRVTELRNDSVTIQAAGSTNLLHLRLQPRNRVEQRDGG